MKNVRFKNSPPGPLQVGTGNQHRIIKKKMGNDFGNFGTRVSTRYEHIVDWGLCKSVDKWCVVYSDCWGNNNNTLFFFPRLVPSNAFKFQFIQEVSSPMSSGAYVPGAEARE